MKIDKINRQSIAISGFTSGLKHYSGMPQELFVQGILPGNRQSGTTPALQHIPATRPPCVAIVGSRRPSSYGIEVTQRFATALAKRGVVIISGLALGIDAIAHQACLDAGGTTVAVLPGGLKKIYPRSNAGLAQRIITSGGALISEYPHGDEPRAYHFLARNRLVSGLADAVLVTEATDRSGTFSTVAHAITQNKDVFAVPGPITSLLSAGSNRVLQQGAHIALTPDDILRSIAPHLVAQPGRQQQLVLGDTPLEVTIIEALQTGLRDGEAVQAYVGEHTTVIASEFLQTLTMMELKGTVRALGGNKWAIGE